jgi:pilus assembly protein CpaB
MRPKSLLLLALALGCGLVASIGISQVMDHKGGGNKLETVPIYVATHNINLGDPIDAKMVSLQEWPKDRIPRGVISTLEELEGRRPRATIFEGEPILEGKLLAAGQVADPIKSIPKNMRLKTIAVDAEKSAAGLLGPGDRVDVQLYVQKDERKGINAAKSKIILQNIRVFAIDQTVQRSADGGEERSIAKTVSLMLTPKQASTLSLAEQVGEISLIPRNPDDDQVADSTEVTIEDLMGDGEKNSREREQGLDVAKDEAEKSPGSDLLTAVESTAAAPPVKPPFRMEVIEAQNVREVMFDGETGRPIREVSTTSSAGGPTPDSSAPDPTGRTSATQADSDKELSEFPIELEPKK